MKKIYTFLILSLSFLTVACTTMNPENPKPDNPQLELPLTGYINWRGFILSMPPEWSAVEVDYAHLLLENAEGQQISFVENCALYEASPSEMESSIGEFSYLVADPYPYTSGEKQSYELWTDDYQGGGCRLIISVDTKIPVADFEALLQRRSPDVINWYEFKLDPPHKMDWVIQGGIAGMGPLYFSPAAETGLINGYNAGCFVDPSTASESVIHMDFWMDTPPPPQVVKPGYTQTQNTITLNEHEVQVTEIKPDENMGMIPYNEASHQVLYYVQMSQTRWLRIFTTKPYQVQTEALLEQITNQIP